MGTLTLRHLGIYKWKTTYTRGHSFEKHFCYQKILSENISNDDELNPICKWLFRNWTAERNYRIMKHTEITFYKSYLSNNPSNPSILTDVCVYLLVPKIISAKHVCATECTANNLIVFIFHKITNNTKGLIKKWTTDIIEVELLSILSGKTRTMRCWFEINQTLHSLSDRFISSSLFKQFSSIQYSYSTIIFISNNLDKQNIEDWHFQ